MTIFGIFRRAPVAVTIFAGLAAFQSGCTGGAGAGAKGAGDGLTRRDTKIVHEACDVRAPGSEKLDANGDGRADVTVVRAGGREKCRSVDLNFDGTVDVWSYLDDGGRIRRREADYDRDGRIDEISIYRGGVLVERQRATTLANRLDTWQFFNNGALARTERDANGDAVIDQWWEYPKAGCPMIHTDVDGDGRPDLGSTIDYCKETGYVPPERHQFRRVGPTFERPGSLPEEVESKDQAEKAPESKPATPPPAKPKAPAGGKP